MRRMQTIEKVIGENTFYIRPFGAFAAAMGGVDAVVFTAGIGENMALVREAVCRDLGFMGITLCPERNAQRGEPAGHGHRGGYACHQQRTLYDFW